MFVGMVSLFPSIFPFQIDQLQTLQYEEETTDGWSDCCRARSPFDMDAYRPSCSNTCPSEFAMIVHDCIKSNPEKRPSASEVCSRLNHALSTLCPLNSNRQPAAALSSSNNGSMHNASNQVTLGSRHSRIPTGPSPGANTAMHHKTASPKKANIFLRCFGQ
jgi:hypothetical protein